MAVAMPQTQQAMSSAEEPHSMTGVMSYLNSRLPQSSKVTDKDFEIPIIDLTSSFSTSAADRKAVAEQIRKACTTSGFFYITQHGVPLEACDRALREAERFFKTLTKQQKEAIHMRNSDLHRGWEPSDFTSLHGAVETKEAFNWGYEAALDPTGGDGKYVELDGRTREKANVWPNEEDLPEFYAGVKQYYGAILSLVRHLFRIFALALDLPEDHFDGMMTHPGAISRMIHYPGVKTGDDQDGNVGLGAHTDYECFTILLCSSTPGLEILTPSNTWTSAPAVPGSFIVNVGDFLMRWSNGVFKSTIHRVMNRTGDERYSIPTFCSINYDEVIETLPTCIQDDNPARFPPVRAGQYILDRLNDNLTDGTGQYGVVNA